jgi:hypothetical protein
MPPERVLTRLEKARFFSIDNGQSRRTSIEVWRHLLNGHVPTPSRGFRAMLRWKNAAALNRGTVLIRANPRSSVGKRLG